jgi:1-phosphatidylinositol-4-phosphate 5-kinase
VFSLQYRSGSLFRRSEAVNFALHDDGTIRQASTSTDSARSTHITNNFINQIGNRIRQRLAPTKRSFFMFTDYCPKQFAKMRELSGITNDDYLDSFKSTTMPSFSEGRSGAFLYFSSDRKYIVKTTTKVEFEKLMQILPDYVNYFIEELAQGHQPLITRYLGAHKIIMYDIPLYFVIMQNICPSVQEKYDLKGSWVNRHSSKKKDYNPKDSRPKKFHIASGDQYRALNRRQDGAQLFLDNDLQTCFLLDPKVSKVLADQILRDIKLLAGLLRLLFRNCVSY